MNKSKIEWCDYTWNPVTGCLHGCKYCYAAKIAHRFDGRGFVTTNIPDNKIVGLRQPIYKRDKSGNVRIAPYPYGFCPTLHRYRLNEPQKVKKPSKIFVSSMGDLFGEWVPDEWILETYMACQRADQHTYLFLTKNPRRYSEIYRSDLDYRINMWFGTSITNSTDMTSRGFELFLATGGGCKRHANRFLSIEPLLGEIDSWTLVENIHYFGWVIIGAQTGPGAKPPKPEWVQSIIDQCRAAGVPVFLKNNLKWPVKIQEWPE